MLTRDYVSDPAWSPDGTRIAFTMEEHRGETTTPAVYVRHADGRISRLTSGANPTWSPDGMRLAFERAGGIYIINDNGGETKRLGAGESPDWSPSGEDILLTLSSSGTVFPEDRVPDLYVMSATGGERTRLTEGPYGKSWQGWSRDGSWSPDGKEIVFVSLRSAEELEGIWTMSADGRNAKMIRLEEYCGLSAPDWQALQTER